MDNIESSFNKLVGETFFTYRGYRGERFISTSGERIYYRHKSFTVEDFKRFIDNYIKSGAKTISNSIRP